MNPAANNPWAARFAPLLNRDEIARRATLAPVPLGDISHLPQAAAVKALKAQLESVYFPTAQCVDILYGWASLAYQHCLEYYPDTSTFLGNIYAEESPFPEFRPPFCLTGPAGIGKTELVKAFDRIQEPTISVTLDPGYPPFSLPPIWSLTVKASARPQELLSQLCGVSGSMRYLVDTCRRLAYRDGLSFLVEDEFQFATGSSSANAVVTQMLLSAGYVGLPGGYVANFSLLHRLMRRPAEDRHRLLSNPIILLPEAPESEDWCSTLKEQKAAASKILKFDPIEDGSAIHRYSGGDLRAEVDLLIAAYVISRQSSGKVTLREIELAYKSTAYTVYRRDIEAIAKLDISDSKVRKQRPDLWCPLDLPASATEKFASRAREGRQKRADEQAIRDSMTREEKGALAKMEKAAAKQPAAPAKAVPIKKVKEPLTAAGLGTSLAAFRDRI